MFQDYLKSLPYSTHTYPRAHTLPYDAVIKIGIKDAVCNLLDMKLASLFMEKKNRIKKNHTHTFTHNKNVLCVYCIKYMRFI